MISKVKYFLKRCWYFLFPTEKMRSARIDVKLRTEFYSQFVQPGDLCFDIGANYGNRIAPLLALRAKIVAVEPQQKCHEALKSKYGNRIQVVPMGIGSTKGIAQLHIADASTISSFSVDWIESVKNDRFKENSWNTTVDVEMTTLDSLIATFGTPSFIKIDVEGYEVEVLKGLSQPIQIISFEYTVPEQVENAKTCIALIHQSNPNIECNFSVGESMQFFFNIWKSPQEMMQYIETEEFQKTLFGDIYCRIRKHNAS